MGRRGLGFLIPPDDISIRVCQKHLKCEILRAANPIPKFTQSDVAAQGKSGHFARMDSDE